MAILSPDPACSQDLANGEPAARRTEHIATQLLSERMVRSPASAAQTAAGIHDCHAKWERSLAHDISQFG